MSEAIDLTAQRANVEERLKQAAVATAVYKDLQGKKRALEGEIRVACGAASRLTKQAQAARNALKALEELAAADAPAEDTETETLTSDDVAEVTTEAE